MKSLPEIFKKENYKKIKFKVSKTQHLLIKASINGIKDNFIIDTVASNSCLGFEGIELFQLDTGKFKTTSTRECSI